nr:5467_t:CDS:2 [Entrophospora candida]
MSSQPNANSEIQKFAREARKIDELFDSIHIDLVSIDWKSNKKFASKWKHLKKTWREVLQESRDEISGLDNFMQSFANVELPFLQDTNHTIQEKLNSLENYILEAKLNRNKAEGVRKKFDKLCDSVKTFLASRGFNEIQVYRNVTIKTLYEALSEWAIAFMNFAYSRLCKNFKESNTTDNEELKKAAGKLSNQVKQKE